MAAVAGVLLAAAVVVSVLDLGFYEAFDRPFNPLTDPGYLGSGLDLLQSAVGTGGEYLVAGAIVLVLLGGAALCVWSVAPHPSYRPVGPARVGTGGRRAHRRWALAGVAGAQVGGIQVAGSPAVSLVAGQVDQVRAELHDRAVVRAHPVPRPYAGRRPATC